MAHSRWARPIALLGAAGMVAAALSQPALARPDTAISGTTDPTITLEVGAPAVTMMEPAINGDDVNDTVDSNNELGASRETPEGCAKDIGCALVPIKLDVPASAIPNNQYLVSVTVTWDTQVALNSIPVEGYVYGDELANFLYDNPRALDDAMMPTFTSGQFLEPSALTDTSPPGALIDLVVVNDTGVNTGFTVSASLIDNTPLSSYYPPGVTSYSTYGKGTNTTAVTVPKKTTQIAPSTKLTKPTTATQTKKVTEPPPVGITTVPATTTTTVVPQTVPGLVPAVNPAVVPAPQIAADTTRVAVGTRLNGTLDPALTQLASDTTAGSKLGLTDEALTGNKITQSSATGTAQHSWLVALSLLIPALAVIGWMFFLARKRRRQVGTAAIGTTRTVQV